MIKVLLLLLHHAVGWNEVRPHSVESVVLLRLWLLASMELIVVVGVDVRGDAPVASIGSRGEVHAQGVLLLLHGVIVVG